MSLAPIEVLCIKFPNDFVKDKIASALRALVESNTIRIIDILFIQKNANGEVMMNEIDDLDEVDYSIFDPIIADVTGLISQSDVETIAQSLDNHSLAALMLFEHTWATTLKTAIVDAQGQLLLNERIPSNVIEEIMATQAIASLQ